MSRKGRILVCGILGCFAAVMVFNWAVRSAEVSESTVDLYFKGGEKQLRAEINRSLTSSEGQPEVIEIQPLIHQNGYVYCLFLTDNGRFGDVYYPENENWVKWISLSVGEPIDDVLPEMKKAGSFSEYKNEANFDEPFSPLVSLKVSIDHDSMTNKSVALGANTDTPKTIYVALADAEIAEESQVLETSS